MFKPILQNVQVGIQDDCLTIIGEVDKQQVTVVQTSTQWTWNCTVVCDDHVLSREGYQNLLLAIESTLSAFDDKFGRKIRQYSDNQRHWPIGALVIHKADAKQADMLMKVTGYLPDGSVKTVYDRAKSKHPRTYTNDIANLLDPALFGISTK